MLDPLPRGIARRVTRWESLGTLGKGGTPWLRLLVGEWRRYVQRRVIEVREVINVSEMGGGRSG